VSAELIGHNGFITGIAVSPDGSRALSGGGDRSMRLWDLSTRRQIVEMRGHERPVWAVAFSPDGKQGVSAGYDQVLKIWDLATGKQISV
jgi:WD40 repeat protein